MVANRVHGGGGTIASGVFLLSLWPLGPSLLPSPLPSSSFRRLFMKATFFLIESEKKGVGGGEWEDNVTALCASSERW